MSKCIKCGRELTTSEPLEMYNGMCAKCYWNRHYSSIITNIDDETVICGSLGTFKMLSIEEYNKLQDQIEQLKQQLAEKDKEIERFMSMKNKEQLVNENEALKDTIAIVLAQKRNIVKHKKQLAIQELEKTLNFIENVFDKALKNCSLNNVYYDQILDFIDQQINELKGEK